MSGEPKKVKDILEAAEAINCPVKKTQYFVDEFLLGPMCGQCFPCEMGTYEARIRLDEIATGSGTEDDIFKIKQIGEMMLKTSKCKKGKDTAKFILEHIDNDAFAEHIGGKCSEQECQAFIEYRTIQENCIRCGKCQEVCEYDAIIGEKQVSYKCCFLPFEIRQKRCVKCGECITVCPTNAIQIVSVSADMEATV